MVWIAIFYRSYLLTMSLISVQGWKLLACSRIYHLSPGLVTESPGWSWREGESTRWSSVCYVPLRMGGRCSRWSSDVSVYCFCFVSIPLRSVEYLLWRARPSGETCCPFLTAPFYVVTKRILFIGTASDLPNTFFCFCNTCSFVTFRTSFSVAGPNIILLYSGMASKPTDTVLRKHVMYVNLFYLIHKRIAPSISILVPHETLPELIGSSSSCLRLDHHMALRRYIKKSICTTCN